jgi:hypothetical protein
MLIFNRLGFCNPDYNSANPASEGTGRAKAEVQKKRTTAQQWVIVSWITDEEAGLVLKYKINGIRKENRDAEPLDT